MIVAYSVTLRIETTKGTWDNEKQQVLTPTPIWEVAEEVQRIMKNTKSDIIGQVWIQQIRQTGYHTAEDTSK